MVIAHNLTAMNAQRQFNIVGTSKKKSTEKLSSGYKINRAADDAAGLTISENMRRKIRGLSQGVDNAQDGISMCQIADGALDEIHDMLHRLTELSVKSANGTNTFEDRNAIQEEVTQILSEIDRISESTEFNTIKIFDKGIKETDNSGQIGGVLDENTWLAGVNNISAIGTPLDYSESTYYFSADEGTGITINGHLYNWSDIKSKTGNSIDGLEPGVYSINHNGMEFSLNLIDNSTLQDVAKSMNGVNVTTTGAHESKSWTSTNEYKFFLDYNKSWMDLDVIAHTLNITDSFISIDNNPTFAYSLSGTDWNNILGITAGSSKDSHSNYEVQLSVILADGSKYPVSAAGQAYPLKDAMPFKLEFGIDNCTRDNFINKVNGSELSFYIDEELAHGAKWDLSIIGKHEIEQSNGTTNIKGPFPVQHKEIIDDDDTIDSSRKDLYKQIWIQSGAEEGDGIWLYFGEMNTNVLDINNLNVRTIDDAKESLGKINNALSYVSESRSRIGAQQNRLEHTVLNEDNIIENTQAAESRIRDTDMATEMTNNTKLNILEQAVTSMMAQANQSTQGVLSLLQ